MGNCISFGTDSLTRYVKYEKKMNTVIIITFLLQILYAALGQASKRRILKAISIENL